MKNTKTVTETHILDNVEESSIYWEKKNLHLTPDMVAFLNDFIINRITVMKGNIRYLSEAISGSGVEDSIKEKANEEIKKIESEVMQICNFVKSLRQIVKKVD